MLWSKIEKQLKKRGWSSYRLAREAGISEMILANLRKGRANDIRLSTLIKIADALEVSLDEFR